MSEEIKFQSNEEILEDEISRNEMKLLNTDERSFKKNILDALQAARDDERGRINNEAEKTIKPFCIDVFTPNPKLVEWRNIYLATVVIEERNLNMKFAEWARHFAVPQYCENGIEGWYLEKEAEMDWDLDKMLSTLQLYDVYKEWRKENLKYNDETDNYDPIKIKK